MKNKQGIKKKNAMNLRARQKKAKQNAFDAACSRRRRRQRRRCGSAAFLYSSYLR